MLFCARHWQMQPTVADRLAERVVLEVKLQRHLPGRLSLVQQVLHARQHASRQYRGSARRAGLEEAVNALSLILLDAAEHTVFGDSEGAHDLGLFAHALTSQLSREHAKRALITFGVLEHWVIADEVNPVTIFPDDTHQAIDLASPIGNQG